MVRPTPAANQPTSTSWCTWPQEEGLCKEVSVFLKQFGWCLVGGIACAYGLQRFKATQTYVVEGTALCTVALLGVTVLFSDEPAADKPENNLRRSNRQNGSHASFTGSGQNPNNLPPGHSQITNSRGRWQPPPPAKLERPKTPTADATRDAEAIAKRAVKPCQEALQENLEKAKAIQAQINSALGALSHYGLTTALNEERAAFETQIPILETLRQKQEPLSDAERQQLAQVLQTMRNGRAVLEEINQKRRATGVMSGRYRGDEIDAALAANNCRLVRVVGDGRCGHYTMETARQLFDGERNPSALPTSRAVAPNTTTLQQALADKSRELALSDELIGMFSKPILQNQLKRVWITLINGHNPADEAVGQLFEELIAEYRAVPADADDRETQLAAIDQRARAFIQSDEKGEGWNAYLITAEGCLDKARAELRALWELASQGDPIPDNAQAVRNKLRGAYHRLSETDDSAVIEEIKQEITAYIESPEACIAYLDGLVLPNPPRTWKQWIQDHMRLEIYQELKTRRPGTQLSGLPPHLQSPFCMLVARYKAISTASVKRSVDAKVKVKVLAWAQDPSLLPESLRTDVTALAQRYQAATTSAAEQPVHRAAEEFLLAAQRDQEASELSAEIKTTVDQFISEYKLATVDAAKAAIDLEAETFIQSEEPGKGWQLYVAAQRSPYGYWATNLDLYLYSRLHDVALYQAQPPRQGETSMNWQPVLSRYEYGSNAMEGSRSVHIRNLGAHYDLVLTPKNMTIAQQAWDAKADERQRQAPRPRANPPATMNEPAGWLSGLGDWLGNLWPNAAEPDGDTYTQVLS